MLLTHESNWNRISTSSSIFLQNDYVRGIRDDLCQVFSNDLQPKLYCLYFGLEMMKTLRPVRLDQIYKWLHDFRIVKELKWLFTRASFDISSVIWAFSCVCFLFYLNNLTFCIVWLCFILTCISTRRMDLSISNFFLLLMLKFNFIHIFSRYRNKT